MVGEQLPVDCIVTAAGAVHGCRLAVSAKYREGTEMPTITIRGHSGEQHQIEVYSFVEVGCCLLMSSSWPRHSLCK